MTKFKSGYVAIIGKPNSGKSTLLNAILKQKLSITTNKPQTTRKRIVGIFNDEISQIIFLDTPGILKPAYLLQEKFIAQIQVSINDADIVILLVDIQSEKTSKSILEEELIIKLLNSKKKIICAINKVDLVDAVSLSKTTNQLTEYSNILKVVPISALHNFNIEILLNEIKSLLPEGPKYFPDDQLSSENERFFVSELIREKIFELYSEEIPFSTEVMIEEYKERASGKDYISAVIIVEKETQKPIIIGKNGAAIKYLGQEARKSVEQFLGKEVFLELRVKVKAKWRSDQNLLKNFGYDIDTDD
jgi:GTP-binding protein Era